MYQALYRKWRPKNFNDVSGQPHITTTLRNEIQSDRISHAYLFTGSRGTGKTSCAKILAKAVNCLNPVNGEPCGECEICRGIDSGSILDIIEIDAASNNGVDNIRDIREEVNFTPVQCKYRVYIIDEVHMLSIGAFNALLKTLEEPPAHVIFILATTEVHKLPATILSRCQRFDFKRISTEAIVGRLMQIASGEGYELDDDAAALIARVADGGMRDAVSLLDRCCMGEKHITRKLVNDSAGMAGTEHLFEYSALIASDDCPGALNLVTRLHNDACDIENLCTELIYHFRNLLIAKTVNDISGLVICSDDERSELKERAKQFKLTKILECLDVLEEAQRSMRGSANKKIQLEAATVRLCTLKAAEPETVQAAAGQGTADISPLIKRIEELESKLNLLSSGAVIKKEEAQPEIKKEEKPENEYIPEDIPLPEYAPPAKESVKTQQTKPAETKPEEKPAEAKPQPETKPEPVQPENTGLPAINDGPFEKWNEVLKRLETIDMPLCAVLNGSTATVARNGSFIVINTPNTALSEFITKDSHGKDLMRVIKEISGRPMKLGVKEGVKAQNSVKRDPLEELKEKIDKFNN